MTFDIITYTEEELAALSTVQMQLLRTAQKKKNELEHVMEAELAVFKQMICANGMQYSTLYNHKRAELEKEFQYQVEILREQLIYNLELNEPLTDSEEWGGKDAPYLVDYKLSYVERYAIVKAYYLSIEDTSQRMNLYLSDNVARHYLGSYYTTLMNVLYTYS